VTKHVVVIGLGGLVAAATLARSGLDVTVVEAHIHPGGCAGTFYHQGFPFDAGATLAAGFEPGGIMACLGEQPGIAWPRRQRGHGRAPVRQAADYIMDQQRALAGRTKVTDQLRRYHA
jgi:phytoene dehydrogenase-like protein